MSLTSFITDPEVRAKLRETFPLPQTILEKRALLAPNTNHYSLVGTAFDYLFRFMLQYHYPHASSKPWIAEHVLHSQLLKVITKYDDKHANKIVEFVGQARTNHKQYLKTGILSEDLIRSVLLLAQIDPFFRAGVLTIPFGVLDEGDIKDLRTLSEAIPFDLFHSQSVCLLDPTFGSSLMVGGADVDLVIDTSMIDIKTTQALQFKREHLNQLIGYYTLHRIGGITGASDEHTLDTLGIYFSRHGYLFTLPVEQIIKENEFVKFQAWFEKKAESIYGQQPRIR